MCGCAAGGNRNRSAQQRSATKKPKVFVMPLEYYQAIDTTGWKPAEKTVLRSQINIYQQRGDIYYENIRDIQESRST